MPPAVPDVEVAKKLGVDDLTEREEVHEKFRFGDGGALISCAAFRFPAASSSPPTIAISTGTATSRVQSATGESAHGSAPRMAARGGRAW